MDLNISNQLLGSCIATIVPLLFVAAMIRDKNSKRILLYFCWGTFAGFLSFVGNDAFSALPGQGGRVTLAIAPIVEEICKGLPILLFLRRKKFPQITEQIVYCALASGVGFSIQESIYYFLISSGQASGMLTLVIRTFTTALMHGMSTATLGMGLLITQKQRHILIPMTFGLFALCTSIHALFNLLLPTNFAALALLMPIGLYFAGLVFLDNVRSTLT